MADNTLLNSGTGGDTIRDKDRAGVKTQVVGLDINVGGSEVLGLGDATFGALRITGRPPESLGYYTIAGNTATYSGLAANTPLFSMRWGDATKLAIILKVDVAVVTTVAASTAGLTTRQLIVARSFTVSDTGGTAVTLSGNNNKRRTSQATSVVTNMQFGAPLTAGTRTLDANPVGEVIGWSGLNTTGLVLGCMGSSASGAVRSNEGGMGHVPLLDAITGMDYPIVLAQNEGIVVRIGGTAQPSGSTQQTYLKVAWAEVSAF